MSFKPLTKDDVDFIEDYALNDFDKVHPAVRVAVVKLDTVLSALHLFQEKIITHLNAEPDEYSKGCNDALGYALRLSKECFPISQSSEGSSREKEPLVHLSETASGGTQNKHEVKR